MFKKLNRFLIGVLVVLCVWGVVYKHRALPAGWSEACAEPPFRSEGERRFAIQEGYLINSEYGCIDKKKFAAAPQVTNVSQKEDRAPETNVPKLKTLAEARLGFKTQIKRPNDDAPPLPHPPSQLFVRSDYTNPDQLTLASFVTPDPRDGKKHPAIIWLTGGDSNSLDDFWTPGDESNDQSAQAFRQAGLVMMFPTLRGGNHNGGSKEYFLGEVDDVLAAADHLASLPYVDSSAIYLGGHSTGGTLALLTAETSGRFKSVFAFGPVAMVDSYPYSILPIIFSQYDAIELKLRSPENWIHSLSSPTYLIEGKNAPSNLSDLERLCENRANTFLRCIPVRDATHFSALPKVTRTIAARIMMTQAGIPFQLQEDEFQ